MRRRDLAADLYKAMIQANALQAGGLPDAMWLKACASWCWDAADSLLDADRAYLDRRDDETPRASGTQCNIDGCDAPRIVGSPRCRFHD